MLYGLEKFDGNKAFRMQTQLEVDLIVQYGSVCSIINCGKLQRLDVYKQHCPRYG